MKSINNIPNVIKYGLLILFLIITVNSFLSTDDEKYNVIMISIDTLQTNRLPCFGYNLNTTPNICELAKKSLFFENFIGQSILTPVSQMSLFTSMYPTQNGLTSFFSYPEKNVSVLPLIFKENGYTTAAFGSSPEFRLTSVWGGDSKPSTMKSIYEDYFDVFNFTKNRYLYPESVFEWMEQNNDKDYFLWIPLGNVHYAYGKSVPPSVLEKWVETEGVSDVIKNEDLEYQPILSRIYNSKFYHLNGSVTNLTESDMNYINSMYDAGLFYTDKFIGEIIKKAEKLQKKTIIIIHGVHGEDLGEHGYFNHYDLYDVELKNLLLIYHPDVEPITIHDQISGLSLSPMILKMVNISVPENMYSNDDDAIISLRIPLWEDGVVQYINNSLLEEDYFKKIRRIFNETSSTIDTSIRTQEWKLIHRNNVSILNNVSWYSYISSENIVYEEYELYNLVNDPLEQKNLVNENYSIFWILKDEITNWELNNLNK